MTSVIVILPAGEAFLVDQAGALSLVNAWIQAETAAGRGASAWSDQQAGTEAIQL